MEKDNPTRNQASEEGRKHDPALRDSSAAQPGVNTMSSSKTDPANEELTKTAADNNRRATEEDAAADPSYDEVDNA